MRDEELDLSRYDTVDDIGVDQDDTDAETDQQTDDVGADDDEQDDNQDEEQSSDPVSFGFGDDPEPEDQPEPPSKLRNIISQQAREIERLKAIAEPKPAKIEVGPRPRLEDFDFDHDRFDAAVDTWVERKTAADRQDAEQRRAAEEKDREGTKILTDYQGRAKSFVAAHRITDYEDAQSSVEGELGVEKVSLLIAGSPKAEELIYALHKNPSKLRALANITNLPRFMYEAAMLQKDIKVRQGRKAPPVDQPVRGGGSTASGDRRLAQLEAEAARTGDRAKVVAYKAALRERN